MRLLVKTSIYYLLLAVPALIVTAFICYGVVNNEIIKSTDESLLNEKLLAQHFIESNDTLSHYYIGFDKWDEITKTTSNVSTQNVFSDTSLYDAREKEQQPYRVLTTSYVNKGNQYIITLRKTTIEADDLLTGIVKVILILFGVLLIGFLLINWWVSAKLWKPFYKTLAALKSYELKIEESLQTSNSGIKEFDDLNDSLQLMTKRIYKDFNAQKQFTENAAHELQTPLAIIQSKIELLIQSNKLGEMEMTIIQTLHEAANRISQLNKALLLLSKIENHQFKEIKTVSIKETIEKLIANYSDIALLKNIKIVTLIERDINVKMNAVLCDVLLSNLILNAIKHNSENGSITITIKNNTFAINNMGKPLAIANNTIFQRFKKNDQATDSLGLGLSIVKEITLVYGFDVQYNYVDDKHLFIVYF